MYTSLDKYSTLNPESLIQVYREDATNCLIRLPIEGETNNRYRVQWRLKVVGTAWHILEMNIIDLDGFVSDVDIGAPNLAYENVFQLGKNGDVVGTPANAFDFVGSIHLNQTQTADSFLLDDIDIASLATGESAYGEQAERIQTIDLLYPNDASVAAEQTLTHTFTSDRLRVVSKRVFNSDQTWEIYSDLTAMFPALESGADTIQVEGHSAVLANNDDNSWLQSGTEATWIDFSDSGHDYVIRLSLPTGGPNLAGLWTNTGTLKAAVQDRSDSINKGNVWNVSETFAERLTVAGATIESRTDYTLIKV